MCNMQITNQCSVLSKTYKCKQLEKACTDAKYIVENFKKKKTSILISFVLENINKTQFKDQ